MHDDERPQQRWNPGARYRPSVLAGLAKPDATATAAAQPDHLPGRLFRGPAQRTGVFERSVWRPRAASSARRGAGDTLASALEGYRAGALSTSGLVRAVGRALAS
jgi:hypothetical protein